MFDKHKKIKPPQNSLHEDYEQHRKLFTKWLKSYITHVVTTLVLVVKTKRTQRKLHQRRGHIYRIPFQWFFFFVVF